VSQTPEQNATDLLAGLPKQAKFDVITHSRGGLALRYLVERQAALGADAAKFELGQAILVASPNVGTPLATADRFDKLISWWANILEQFPENPMGTTIEYIGEALTFIARHVVDALPGLEAMDMSGDQISVLNTKSVAPPAAAYFAIISNHRPQGALLARMLDLGIDAIFGMANDLVVPTTGAWKTEAHPSWVPGTRVGCFGINLNRASSKDGVIHTTYFSQPETVDFLLETFLGQPLGLQPVDLDINPPFFLRRSLTAAATADAPGGPQTAPSPGTQTRDSQGFLPTALNEADNILQLFLISPDDHIPPEAARLADGQTAILLATYRNARVVETIYLRKPRGAKPQLAAGSAPVAARHRNHVDDQLGGGQALGICLRSESRKFPGNGSRELHAQCADGCAGRGVRAASGQAAAHAGGGGAASGHGAAVGCRGRAGGTAGISGTGGSGVGDGGIYDARAYRPTPREAAQSRHRYSAFHWSRHLSERFGRQEGRLSGF
jgi:hypothetical protein